MDATSAVVLGKVTSTVGPALAAAAEGVITMAVNGSGLLVTVPAAVAPALLAGVVIGVSVGHLYSGFMAGNNEQQQQQHAQPQRPKPTAAKPKPKPRVKRLNRNQPRKVK